MEKFVSSVDSTRKNLSIKSSSFGSIVHTKQIDAVLILVRIDGNGRIHCGTPFCSHSKMIMLLENVNAQNRPVSCS